ncbi:hypothetical protein [Vannielia sp. SX4]|uniref:hypothetical protein n=1 Tax=Vannielia sp. SX4 TaxID=3463852 RepID=UPI004057E795
MAHYEIITEEAPEYKPSRTTGDPVGRTKVIVEWKDVPSSDDLKRFEDQRPPHLYSAFHFVEGVGMTHQN